MKLGKPSSVVTPFIDYASLSGAFVQTRVHKTVHFAVARMLPRVLAICSNNVLGVMFFLLPVMLQLI